MSNDQLSIARKFSFGVGHVLNDLTASMWFSYLLLYLHRIVLFDNAIAGYMVYIKLKINRSFLFLL
jgi:Na+/melibiose symporter-like transporter